MLTLTHELMERFRRVVYDKCDLHFMDKKLVLFERNLRERLRARGVQDFESYYGLLTADHAELDALVRALTTNKTFFFRDRPQFRALREAVIPELIGRRNQEAMRSWGGTSGAGTTGRNPAMSIRIWSAACSTGEEAYSIAFTLLEAVRYPRAWELEVLATDINSDVLGVASRGAYGEDAVREIDPELRDRYMAPDGKLWTVGEQARKVVHFREGNVKDLSLTGEKRAMGLTMPDGSSSVREMRGGFDAIFCRNVMIYFDRDGQQRLVDAMYDCLRPGGYLFTGDSEPLHLFSHGFVRPACGDALYYRKPI